MAQGVPGTSILEQHKGAIVNAILQGKTFSEIAEDIDVSVTTLWNAKAPEFAQAREEKYDRKLTRWFGELEGAANGFEVSRAREAFRAASWLAERECPQRWGQRDPSAGLSGVTIAIGSSPRGAAVAFQAANGDRVELAIPSGISGDGATLGDQVTNPVVYHNARSETSTESDAIRHSSQSRDRNDSSPLKLLAALLNSLDSNGLTALIRAAKAARKAAHARRPAGASTAGQGAGEPATGPIDAGGKGPGDSPPSKKGSRRSVSPRARKVEKVADSTVGSTVGGS